MDLDTIVVMLMGAVDAPPASSTSCSGFRAISVTSAGKGGWRSRLAGQGQPLADLFASGAPSADVLTILSRLRNTARG
jgi:hypothetical protein